MSVSPRRKPPQWAFYVGGCGCSALGLLAIPGAVLLSMLLGREAAQNTRCQMHLRQLGQAISMYEQDFDNRMPPAATWMDATFYQHGHDFILHCPTVAPSRIGPKYGFAYNSDLSLKPFKEVRQPASTPMLFDATDLSRNASGPPAALMPASGRHKTSGKRGNNVAYADGHVRFLEVPGG